MKYSRQRMPTQRSQRTLCESKHVHIERRHAQLQRTAYHNGGLRWTHLFIERRPKHGSQHANTPRKRTQTRYSMQLTTKPLQAWYKGTPLDSVRLRLGWLHSRPVAAQMCIIHFIIRLFIQIAVDCEPIRMVSVLGLIVWDVLDAMTSQCGHGMR